MDKFEVNYDGDGQYDNELSPDTQEEKEVAPQPEEPSVDHLVPEPAPAPAPDATPEQLELIEKVMALKDGEKLSVRFGENPEEVNEIIDLFAANGLPEPEVKKSKYNTFLTWQK
jgi:hypothetical protein